MKIARSRVNSQSEELKSQIIQCKLNCMSYPPDGSTLGLLIVQRKHCNCLG